MDGTEETDMYLLVLILFFTGNCLIVLGAITLMDSWVRERDERRNVIRRRVDDIIYGE